MSEISARFEFAKVADDLAVMQTRPTHECSRKIWGEILRQAEIESMHPNTISRIKREYDIASIAVQNALQVEERFNEEVGRTLSG